MRNRWAFRSCIPPPVPAGSEASTPCSGPDSHRAGRSARGAALGVSRADYRLGYLGGVSAERLPLRERHGAP
jgi:hypothetical protein